MRPARPVRGAERGLGQGLAAAIVLRRTSLSDGLPFGPFLALGSWLTWLYGPLMLA